MMIAPVPPPVMVARMPSLNRPVTEPLVVTDRVPAPPLMLALIPGSPVTVPVPVITVRLPPLVEASMPSKPEPAAPPTPPVIAPAPVTTLTLPVPSVSAWMPSFTALITPVYLTFTSPALAGLLATARMPLPPTAAVMPIVPEPLTVTVLEGATPPPKDWASMPLPLASMSLVAACVTSTLPLPATVANTPSAPGAAVVPLAPTPAVTLPLMIAVALPLRSGLMSLAMTPTREASTVPPASSVTVTSPLPVWPPRMPKPLVDTVLPNASTTISPDRLVAAPVPSPLTAKMPSAVEPVTVILPLAAWLTVTVPLPLVIASTPSPPPGRKPAAVVVILPSCCTVTSPKARAPASLWAKMPVPALVMVITLLAP